MIVRRLLLPSLLTHVRLIHPSLSSLSKQMDFQRPNDLKNGEALQLVSQFFPKVWRQLKESDINVTRAQVGLNNEIYFVARNTAADKSSEPEKVVIRKFSSIARDLDPESNDKQKAGMWLSQVEQTVVFMELARLGLGPKLYGLFDGGRIEEFIDCHNISYKESCKHEIESDIAVNLARMHAMSVPLRKPGYKFIDVLRSIHSNAMEQKNFYIEMGNNELLQIVNHDFEQEFKLLQPLLDFQRNRMVFMHWDSHFGNIAVLNHPQQNQAKSLIFDCEIAGYNIRGKDLGTFLISRSGFFPMTRDDRCLETNQQFKPFLQSYLGEWERVCDSSFDPKSKDSFDQVMVETLVGGMTSSLIYLLRFVFLAAKMQAATPEAQSLVRHMPPLFQAFRECRDALLNRYPDVRSGCD